MYDVVMVHFKRVDLSIPTYFALLTLILLLDPKLVMLKYISTQSILDVTPTATFGSHYYTGAPWTGNVNFFGKSIF